MNVLTSRISLERRRASKVSYIGDRMHVFGGIVLDASCGVWWMGGTALGNRDGFFPSAKGR